MSCAVDPEYPEHARLQALEACDQPELPREPEPNPNGLTIFALTEAESGVILSLRGPRTVLGHKKPMPAGHNAGFGW